MAGAGRKRGERERSGERTFQKTIERERSVEREVAERIAGVTKIGLSAEWQISRSRSANMLWPNVPVDIFLPNLACGIDLWT